MKKRSIRMIVAGIPARDGAGVNLQRVLGHKTKELFDPFLMLDSFDSTNPDDYTNGFPWHPHRGIETITYLVSGSIEHEDSLMTTEEGLCKAIDCLNDAIIFESKGDMFWA